jgi:hypothetical protein
MPHDPDAYDRTRDDEDFDRGTGKDTDESHRVPRRA